MATPFPSISFLIALFLSIVAGTLNAQVQSSMRFGTTLGGSVDFYQMKGLGTFDFPYVLDFIPYGRTISHSGRVGIAFEYRLSPVWGLTAHVDYATGSADFARTTTNRDAYELELLSTGVPSGDTINPYDLVLGYEYAARVDYNRIDYALMAWRELLGDDSTVSIGAALGPVMSRMYRLIEHKSVKILQERSTDTIVQFAPPDEDHTLTREDLGTRLVQRALNQAGSIDWHFSLRCGLFARFGSFQKGGVVIVPGVYFDYGVRELLEASSHLTLNALIARVDVTVGL